ncbi:F28C11.7 [Arabidopsis thaliana]|uniref:F28C11.7 n=1 Tax=Arabidopsis thaliana TaxID=3702 RepID=Q9LQD3_ARATH|nr:F28C11.7 [Arabidopsis thaliana]
MAYVVFVASYQAWWLLSFLSGSISSRFSFSVWSELICSSRRYGFLGTLLCKVVFIVIGGTAVRLVGSSLSPTEWLVVKLCLSFVW